MPMTLPGGLRSRMVSVFIMLLAGACLGCGGSTPQQPDITTAANEQLNPSPLAPQLPTLPGPADLARASSAIQTSLTCPGGDYRGDLAHQNISAQGEGALFSPGAVAGGSLADSAFAIYEFDLSALDSPAEPFGIELWAVAAPSNGAAVVYAGLGDPGRDMWEWVQLTPDPAEPEPLAFSWGVHKSGAGSAGLTEDGAYRSNPYLPLAIVVFGVDEFRVSSVTVKPSAGLPAGGTIAFRKGWDGTVKGSTKGRLVDLERDALAGLHATYYDDSCGQLYHMWLSGRSWTTQAVDCDGDVGLGHDLLPTADGGLLLPFYDATTMTGQLRRVAPPDLESMIWSPRSNFESGMDDAGLTIDAGRNPSAIVDDLGTVHVFYEDSTNGRIRHAWKPMGVMDWLHEYISPEGVTEGQPIGLNSSLGLVCVTRKGWDGCIYRPSADGWSGTSIASDLHNPLDPSSELAHFDAACRDATVVVAMACTGGQRIVRYDLSTGEKTEDQIFSDRPGGGCFIDLVLMGDGSVRIANYNAIDRTIYFETGDIPDQEQFTSLPAVQYGEDQDCDGLAFWVDLGSVSSGLHDAFLVELSSSPAIVKDPAGEKPLKKEFKGHVTLLK